MNMATVLNPSLEMNPTTNLKKVELKGAACLPWCNFTMQELEANIAQSEGPGDLLYKTKLPPTCHSQSLIKKEHFYQQQRMLLQLNFHQQRSRSVKLQLQLKLLLCFSTS